MADLGLGSYRFSLEWSRIEPEEGEFSLVALDHYRRMAATCHEHGLIPVVTFHHFTHPALAGRAADLGGAPCSRPLRPLLRTGHRPPGRPHRDGLHPQRAQRGGHHGLAPRALPAGGDGTGSRRASTRPWWPPTARGSRPSGRARATPGRPDPVDDRLSGGAGRRGVARADPAAVRGRVPRGHRRATTSSACRPTPGPGRARRPLGGRGGRADHPDGLRVLARGPGGHRPPGLGGHRRTAVYVTENGIGTDDDARGSST